MFSISVKADIAGIRRSLDRLTRRQLPYATALALNSTAELVRIGQQENLRKVLDAPTPFTINAVAVRRASKSRPEALVYIKPVAAAYLLPYERGGKNKLNSKALLKPVNARVNQYGNLPRNFVKNAKAKPNMFVGKVQTKNGIVDGVWQRTAKKRGSKTGLKLLVDFTNAHEATQRIDYRGVGTRIVRAVFSRELRKGIDKAMATAR